MAGINDIFNGIGKATTFKNIDYIIAEIVKKSPETCIYLQSILPVADSSKTQQIIDYNNTLSSLANKNHIVFINIFPRLLYKNSINPSYTFDGIHLRLKAYLIWKSSIDKYLK